MVLTWSHILREGKGLTMSEDTVLRKMLRPKMQESLHIEELHDLYYSKNIIRVVKSKRMRLAGHVACTREERKV
jgi:hypothetical protein